MTESAIKVPTWFWIVAGLALLWNLMGMMAFLSTASMTDLDIAQLPAAEQEIYRNTPFWATLAFAIAVLAGVFGSIGLLMRKSWAKPVFIVSLIGVLVQHFHGFVLANGLEIYGAERLIMPGVVLVIAALLIWLASVVQKKVWYA